MLEHPRTLGPILGLLAAAIAGCGTPAPPPQTGPGQRPAAQAQTAPQPAAQPIDDAMAADAPKDHGIGELQPDPNQDVRVKGIISQVVGMRLVPPKFIFKIRDDTGTVTAVINEKVSFSEGTKVELVGRYKAIPSPMYSGPGEAPEEPVFVVERFLDMP